MNKDTNKSTFADMCGIKDTCVGEMRNKITVSTHKSNKLVYDQIDILETLDFHSFLKSKIARLHRKR